MLHSCSMHLHRIHRRLLEGKHDRAVPRHEDHTERARVSSQAPKHDADMQIQIRRSERVLFSL